MEVLISPELPICTQLPAHRVQAPLLSPALCNPLSALGQQRGPQLVPEKQ